VESEIAAECKIDFTTLKVGDTILLPSPFIFAENVKGLVRSKSSLTAVIDLYLFEVWLGSVEVIRVFTGIGPACNTVWKVLA
jgi:hypothetical protein